MADTAIINASPLIFLTRGNHLHLLRGFASCIWVPEPVATEIRYRGPDDVTAVAIAESDLLITKPVGNIPPQIARWSLGAGESAVLALAMAHPGSEAIIDDLAGRRCANRVGIPVRGTLGIVLNAKRHGLIPLARPVIEELLGAGLYLSRPVIDEALRRVGE